MASPQVWFITGAGTGIGRCLVEHLLAEGEIVVATLRKTDNLADLSAQHTADKLLVLPLDVTSEPAIGRAFAAAKAKFGRVDVVFNNAGYGIVGEFEGVSLAEGRALFEVNVWGAAAVSKEAVRFFREENPAGAGGRLLQASSFVAFNSVPAASHYSASKFALEGLSEALAKELNPAWNIKITLVEFGSFQTSFGGKMTTAPPHPAYSDPSLPSNFVRKMAEENNNRGDAAKTSKFLVKVARMDDPPLRLPLGKEAVESIKARGLELVAAVDKYSAWSEGLERDDL